MDLTKVESKAISLSIVAGLIGVALSIAVQDGTWFGRSGAIISIVAVWFASRELKSGLQSAAGVIEGVLEEQKAEFIKDAEKYRWTEEQTRKLWEKIERDSRAAFADANRSVMLRVHKVELYLFIIGTFIWGFGDLPFALYYGAAPFAAA